MGRIVIEYQQGGEITWFGRRRVPVQIITRAESDYEALQSVPFLRKETRLYRDGFNEEALKWLDWGD